MPGRQSQRLQIPTFLELAAVALGGGVGPILDPQRRLSRAGIERFLDGCRCVGAAEHQRHAPQRQVVARRHAHGATLPAA